MTNAERAKQFAPYAALKGFGDYILAMERETEERKILGEDAQEELNRRLQALQIGDIIAVTYYLNRQYVEAFGKLQRINREDRQIQVGGMIIPLADIFAVKGEQLG